MDRECEFHSYVLKTGYWPGFHLLQNVTLPTEMSKCVTNFQNYYTSREPAKKVSDVVCVCLSILELSVTVAVAADVGLEPRHVNITCHVQ
jgi:hypothetical protein